MYIKVKKILCMLYVFSFGFVVTKNGNSNLPWFIPYLHCCLWIMIGYLYNGKSDDIAPIKSITRTVFLIFIRIQFIFWAFSLLAYISNINNVYFNTITRAISTTGQAVLILLAIINVFKIFKEKTIIYSAIGLLWKNIYGILIAGKTYGFGQLFSIVLRPFKYDGDWSVSKILASIEFHDLTFALGFVLIFLVFILLEYDYSKKEKRSLIRLLVFVSFFIYVGYKRIQMLSLVVIVLMLLFVKGRSKKSISFWSVLITTVTSIGSYFYVWLIDSGVLSLLLVRFGVNSRGRIEAYISMSELFTFSPTFIGLGKESALRMKERLWGSSVLVGHSDVLYTFMDFGFWGFGVWIVYLLYVVPKKLSSCYGSLVAKYWLFTTVYAFITYLTDNTLNYFAFQSCYIAALICFIYTGLVKNRK